MLRHFKQTLDHGKGRAIREEYVRFAMYLEAVEQNQFDFDEFSESFWNENGEGENDDDDDYEREDDNDERNDW